MIVVTLQREKCIGCHYCVEWARDYFRISKKDGKSILIHSRERKGFHTLHIPNDEAYNSCQKASKVCPVKIISVSKKN